MIRLAISRCKKVYDVFFSNALLFGLKESVIDPMKVTMISEEDTLRCNYFGMIEPSWRRNSKQTLFPGRTSNHWSPWGSLDCRIKQLVMDGKENCYYMGGL